MAVGCLIYLTKEGKVFHRIPFWPWPVPGVYPKQLENGTWIQFFPHSYFRFAIGDQVSPFPPVPYIPSSQRKALP